MAAPSRNGLPAWTAPLSACALVFAVSLPVRIQGFNLLDDGLWVLGARVVADGGGLYRNLFSIYGPARYYFLLPFFLAAGKSALGLALAKAAADGLAAAAGFWLTRRLGAGRWAWLVPLGVVALGPVHPRYVAAALLAGYAALALQRGLDGRRGLLLGAGWGVLTLFGFDMFGYGAVILGATFLASLHGGEETRPVSRRAWPAIAGGLAAVLAVSAAVLLASGALDAWFWDTVIYPVTRFRGSMGLSWWREFSDTAHLGEPFAPFYTGERLDPVWPGQVLQRVWSLRLLYLLVWLVPVAGIWRTWARKVPALAPVVGLACAGWATLLGRGDVSHLTMSWFGSLLLVPPLVAWLRGCRKRLAAGAVGLLVVILAPFVLENLWLATHLGRDTLRRWERRTARIYMGRHRIEGIEKLLAFTPADPRVPLLAWPMQPGLTFLRGSALATSQVTLLAGEIRDPGAVIGDLRRTRPPVILMGKSSGAVPGVRTFRQLAPDIYPYIRTHYTIYGSSRSDRERFRILRRHDGPPEDLMSLPLKNQLPTAEQNLEATYTPLIQGDTSVAQSLRVRELPLHGVTVKLSAQGPYPVTIPVRLTVLEMFPSGKAVIRTRRTYPVTFGQDLETVEMPFDPIADSVGKTMVFMLENDDPQGPPFVAAWDLPTDGREPELDFYPEGAAMVNMKATPVDLYFLAY